MWSVPGKSTPPRIISPIIQPNKKLLEHAVYFNSILTHQLTKCRHFPYIPFQEWPLVLDNSALQHMASSWRLCLQFVPIQSREFLACNLTLPQCLMALSPVEVEREKLFLVSVVKWCKRNIRWRKHFFMYSC